MGLFKLLGKIAKGGLSVVTHGASDKVISAARAVIGAKPKRANAVPFAGTSTAQERALINKLQPIAPRVRITERREPVYKSKAAYKRKRSRRWTQAMQLQAENAYRAEGATSSAKPRSPRRPPSGGLDLRAMAQQWKAAGKPMPWVQWIKTNPLRKA